MKQMVAGAALAAAIAWSGSASAATTITGSITGLDYRTTDPGLVITASPLAFPTVVLNTAGDSVEHPVLTIGTNEGTVNTNFLSLYGEDTDPYPISAAFTFTSPAGTTGPAITGTTRGFIQLFSSCGLVAGGCGRVTWGGPSTFSFGNGGQFTVGLSDALFDTPGTATVNARFTLLASGVPEPSTWAMMIIGLGLAGAAMRRRAARVSVRYA